MELEERMLRLIAVGASISANCQPCLQTNVAKALECGASDREIRQAIWVGTLVRRGAASKMDQFRAEIMPGGSLSIPSPDGKCECAA